jgi:hypothetical protein
MCSATPMPTTSTARHVSTTAMAEPIPALRSLADLRRFLDREDARVTLVGDTWLDGRPRTNRMIGVVRKPILRKGHCVQFQDGSWLVYALGKRWTFSGNLAVYTEVFSGTRGIVLTYRLTISQQQDTMK